MNIARRLANLTNNIEPDSNSAPAAEGTDSARTSPGRLMAAQNRILEAEDRAEAATREATDSKLKLADALARIAALEAEGVGETAEEVDLDDFVEVPGRRRVLAPIERTELVENLRRNPIVTPVSYRRLPDGKKEIVSGHNRIDIYRNDLGRKKILAVPFKGTAQEAELAAIFANLLAPSLPDFEKYRQFMRLQTESGYTRADIITASGLSDSHVSRIFAFERLPAAALSAIAKRPDRVGGNAAEEFAAIAAKGDPSSVVAAIEALVSNDAMLQKQALEMARPKPLNKASTSAPRTITFGKRKLCDVSIRSGTIGLRFSGKEGAKDAERWAEKIEAFIKQELEREAGK
ncbi:ParB/RepB/Spo0J family partition protein [Burkholderia gladioli]|uniref:ParB/RepB/Spo0J family partition protein n=1 Tax=Burkholderia gladioli TaxID=28095 RepID=UPI001641BA6D|nr:chromosome partitioning protein ParB [Burkholderia gladioli]